MLIRFFILLLPALLTALAFPFAALPAAASASGWFENEGGRFRIVAAPPSQDGVIRAILDIELKPGWKTYWLDPGSSGIPPRLDISESHNLDNVEILFPAPEWVDDGYSVWAGYTQSVRLPLVFQPADPLKPAILRAGLLLGICEKICIPAQADIALPIDDEITPLRRAMIEGAFSELPDGGDETMAVTAAQLGAGEETLRITAEIPDRAADNAQIFIAAPDGWSFGVPKRVERSAGNTVFEAKVKRKPEVARDEAVIHAVLKTLTRSVAADLHFVD